MAPIVLHLKFVFETLIAFSIAKFKIIGELLGELFEKNF